MITDDKTYRTEKYVVACQPWEATAYISSEHSSLQAAERAAERAEKQFRRSNGSTAYGYAWIAGVTQSGETARAAAQRITRPDWAE